ncbi:MAG TPA: matrixin family metalloprotease [Acidothermaceae bacterium]
MGSRRFNRARSGAAIALAAAVVAGCGSARAEQQADHFSAAHVSAAQVSAAHPSSATPPAPSARKSASPVTSPASASAPVASDYTVTTNRDGSVVRWNPCAPIHYTVNAALAADPVGALADTQAAIARVAAASGLTFRYDGPTTMAPTRAWLDGGGASSGLVIAWALPGSQAGQSDLFGGDADGEGGWWESGVSKDGQAWSWQIKRGFVVVDPTGSAGYAPGFGPGESRGVLLMHELGHAVGLGHVDNRRDVMFPVITSSSRAQWGPGDLAGLARIGKPAGCIS